MTMESAEAIRNGLAQFCGTESYHRLSPLHGRLVCTDGVAWLAEHAGCFWLVDIIASYQTRCMKDRMLRDVQFWSLKVAADKTADLICERDTGDVAIRQKIPYTDFPLPEVKLYVQNGGDVIVCLLPSEY